ncbi:MAG: zinc ribbon domain-containing protein, partial [Lachnospiraceae bacterium]|nr:zinc ribbon domain-containing protein [Lachnospiraceae bacterium]
MGRFCEQCGAQLQEGAAFCNMCGAPTEMQVQNAGEKNLGAVPEMTFSNGAQQTSNAQPVLEKKEKKGK